MRTSATVSIILCSLVCGGVGGYLLRDQQTDGSLVLSVADVVREEYLIAPDSFSRIKNTRNALDALAERCGMEIMDALCAYEKLPRNNASQGKAAGQALERIIRAAETVVQEFDGTEQQLAVTHSLMFALQKAGRFDRWTELYLKALHEHPTHPFVARLATDAVKISTLAGQQDRVLEALRDLRTFEPAFADRAGIEAALNSPHPCFGQAQSFCAVAVVDSRERIQWIE